MSHDKRDGAGMYRPRTDAESRDHMARSATQTREGRFTHNREPDRMGLACDQFSAKLFKNNRVNRDPYYPSVGKERP